MTSVTSTPLARGQKGFAVRYGPWAVVTGASEGIGREFATQLAARGVSLVLVARREDVLAGLAAELSAHTGVKTVVVSADLGTEAGVAAVITATDGLDVGLVVASAGFGTAGQFLALPVARELEMVDVNCRAVVRLAHHFGERLARRGSGGLVLMSSLVAFQGVARSATYSATKAFIQNLAEGLAVELRPAGVDVLACAPGPIRSGFAAVARMEMGLAQTPAAVAKETLDALGRRTTVRPGWLSKLLELSLMFLWRGGRVRVMSQVMHGMTRHLA